ncbi:MAG: DUF4157 domain-containing protein [Myxococcota bacterium]
MAVRPDLHAAADETTVAEQGPGDERDIGSPDDVRSPELRAVLDSAVASEDPQVQFAAATQGSGGELPHRAQMETAFGADLSGVTAHVGQREALGSMGADGAAREDTVAFSEDSPSPEVVAHEVAHVMQARQFGGASSVAAHSLLSRPSDAGEVCTRYERRPGRPALPVLSAEHSQWTIHLKSRSRP